jgi:hypothetical protein
MRRVEHLRAQPQKKPVQAMQRVEEGLVSTLKHKSVAIRVTFQHHQRRSVETFQQHAFDAVETLVKRNDSQVASQIYRIALAYDESKERGRDGEERRKTITLSDKRMYEAQSNESDTYSRAQCSNQAARSELTAYICVV